MYRFEIENSLKQILPLELENRDELIKIVAEFATQMKSIESELNEKFDKIYKGKNPKQAFRNLLFTALAINDGMPPAMAKIAAEQIVGYTLPTEEGEYHNPEQVEYLNIPLTENNNPLSGSLIKDFKKNDTIFRVIIETDAEAYAVWVRYHDKLNDAKNGIRFVCSLASTHKDLDIKPKDRFFVRLDQIWGLSTEK